MTVSSACQRWARGGLAGVPSLKVPLSLMLLQTLHSDVLRKYAAVFGSELGHSKLHTGAVDAELPLPSAHAHERAVLAAYCAYDRYVRDA